MSALLTVANLSAGFRSRAGLVQALDGVSFTLAKGESLAVVGESGCGKSALALTLMGLLPGNGIVDGGSIRFADTELVGMAERDLRRLRGRRMAMVFQDPMTCLTPWLRIGAQLIEQLRVHASVPTAEAERRTIASLDAVGIPEPALAMRKYPHELSGGQRQRVLIAMALSCDPELLIADEPTTALDVTVQAQVLALIRAEQRRRGMGLILITHNLAVARGMCDAIAVMYAGRIVELADAAGLFAHPRHPYTRGLLAALPRLDQPRDRPLQAIPGTPPRRIAAAPGCPFAPRCLHAGDDCRASDPPLRVVNDCHVHACLRDLPGFSEVARD